MASMSVCRTEGTGSKPVCAATRTCCVCKLKFSVDNFSKIISGKSKSKINSRCRKCQRKYSKEHYYKNKVKYLDKNKTYKDKLKEYINTLKSQPCMDCGCSYPPYVMDFDHRENKLFTISRGKGNSKEKLLAEIAKCDVVCANCHRERTHG